MSKYSRMLSVLEKRIRHDDYWRDDVPSQYELAREAGVSRATARRALLHLIDKGILTRAAGGRIVVKRDVAKRNVPLRLAFLAPSRIRRSAVLWHAAFEYVSQHRGVQIRSIEYAHWEDPVILRALATFDGVFLMPSAEAVPADMRTRLLSRNTPLVVIDHDWSAMQLPSIDLLASRQVCVLLEHLWERGHRRIACVNTQPRDGSNNALFDAMDAWLKHREVSCRMFDAPVDACGNCYQQAHQQLSRFLMVRPADFTAVFATTTPAAIGAMRAFRDRDLEIPGDVSFCAIDDMRMARFLCPSLTSISTPDPEPYLSMAVEWMQRCAEWGPELLKEAPPLRIFEGESTRPCR